MGAEEVIPSVVAVESECGAGGFRLGLSVSASFVWRCLTSLTVAPVSTLRSSNRTCGSPCIRLSDKTHAFVHGTSCPSLFRRTSP